jgi:hypothetical protein
VPTFILPNLYNIKINFMVILIELKLYLDIDSFFYIFYQI